MKHDYGTITARLKSFLNANGTITRAKVMELSKFTEKQANYFIGKILESGEIVREGKGRSTHYKISESNRTDSNEAIP